VVLMIKAAGHHDARSLENAIVVNTGHGAVSTNAPPHSQDCAACGRVALDVKDFKTVGLTRRFGGTCTAGEYLGRAFPRGRACGDGRELRRDAGGRMTPRPNSGRFNTGTESEDLT
jgi:hypothetical protein